MKKFIKRVLIFVFLPTIILWTIEVLCLPINFFNHRNWEALLLKTNIPHYGPLYPNVYIQSTEVGDLAHHTPYAVFKKVTWKTDKLGFRNDLMFKKPDIVIIGDSFINGTSLSQEQTFANQFTKALNNQYKIYNCAPFAFNNYVELLEQGILQKPKVIIFSCVEKTVPEVFTTTGKNYNSIREQIKKRIRLSEIAPVIDRATRFYSLKWLSARIQFKTGTGFQSPVNKKMFFLRGKKVENRNNNDLLNTVKAIASYKRFCDKIGVKFIFLPIPNKESVYYDLVPLAKQPDYLFKLESILDKKNIANLNVLAIYNQNKKSGKLLYQLDDTHWNALGVKLVSDALKDMLNK